MRILLDENVPKKLKRAFHGAVVTTVTERGWAGTRNGELLRQAEGVFDVMVTVDKSIQYQNKFTDKRPVLVTFIVRRNKIESSLPLVPAALAALQTAVPGQVINIAESR
jgi:predicted nuclease of predicted toxin-antitoxin system